MLLACVRECLSHTDPGGALVAPGRKVLLKVNMLSAKPPEKAITTHPAFVKAVAEVCMELGAEVFIGDSPAGPEKGIAKYWEKTGFSEVSRTTGAKLVNFESAGSFHAEIDGTVVHVSNAIRDADTVINLPKLKTHSLTMMTGAVKNMYGVLPGFQKGSMHARLPRIDDFSRFLVELYRFISPAITIMDAVVVMEGNGPTSGDPRDVGLILAGTDAAAVDHIAARVMGFGATDVPTNRIAVEMGMTGSENVETTGDTELVDEDHGLVLPGHLRAVRVQGWLLEHMPDAVFRLLDKLLWIKPEMDEECTRCGECVEGCPKNAITITDEETIVDHNLCITCLRCQEVCTHEAVRLKLSPLARLIWGDSS